jgi:hypothetical protein
MSIYKVTNANVNIFIGKRISAATIFFEEQEENLGKRFDTGEKMRRSLC